MEALQHPIPPAWRSDARILILGSFPSPVSREEGFFYAHPQNRFWRVLAAVYGDAVPGSVEEKKTFLAAHRLALWDVIASCKIRGASDASVRRVVPNDLTPILTGAQIQAICTTGGTAYRLYRRWLEPQTGIAAIPLPSTSAANARMREADLTEAYRILLEIQ